MKKKTLLSEVRQLQKIAGILKENQQDIKWGYPEIDSDEFYYEYNPESRNYTISAPIHGVDSLGNKYVGVYHSDVKNIENLDDLDVDETKIEDIERAMDDTNDFNGGDFFDDDDFDPAGGRGLSSHI
jgi:hypothetical protein